MAISSLYSRIGQLGNALAQQHYALTSDLDGPMPWSPTDADRQKLAELLGGRQPTLEETRVFEAGYRESVFRQDGNAHDVRINAVMRHELYAALGRYGIQLPAEGTPERQECELLLSQALETVRQRIEAMTPAPPPPTKDDQAEQERVAEQASP